MPDGALQGVRVLDAGRYVAGPWCAQLLQSLGADVLRVERPAGGEDRWIFPIGPDGASAFFVHCNRGKRATTLQPTRPAGREVMGRLVRWADVIVANVPDETLAAMGLDWETVRAANPRAVLATATTFGTAGPYAGRLGFDGIGQVMSGSTWMNGHASEPMKSFVPWVDYTTAGMLALGVVSALFQRERTGQGTRVEGSLLGSALAVTGHVLTEEAIGHLGRVGTGNRHPAAGPSDIVPTVDGRIIVQVIGDAMFSRWCKLVDRADLLDDPRFASDERRGTNGEALSEVLRSWCASRTTAEALRDLAGAEVPAGALLSPRQALEDPHVRTMLDEASFQGSAGPVPVVRAPVALAEGSVALGSHAPAIGEHTDEVMAALGYDPDAIAALRRDRIV